jgi:hypothetical protein
MPVSIGQLTLFIAVIQVYLAREWLVLVFEWMEVVK